MCFCWFPRGSLFSLALCFFVSPLVADACSSGDADYVLQCCRCSHICFSHQHVLNAFAFLCLVSFDDSDVITRRAFSDRQHNVLSRCPATSFRPKCLPGVYPGCCLLALLFFIVLHHSFSFLLFCPSVVLNSSVVCSSGQFLIIDPCVCRPSILVSFLSIQCFD